VAACGHVADVSGCTRKISELESELEAVRSDAARTESSLNNSLPLKTLSQKFKKAVSEKDVLLDLFSRTLKTQIFKYQV
jgi:hypothetical protein